ncbi:hypothetical protein L1987_33745 [Smallanthus sonchifolius]|uniref:Uncharacterized protein n=1 Tax=Smallanthus sonchifolius TaxID=185202 RepID=A0ACB9HT35_9ASTR|nr:hypothetical protein L1987_33745 [Smallanthus sonchifolius]
MFGWSSTRGELFSWRELLGVHREVLVDYTTRSDSSRKGSKQPWFLLNTGYSAEEMDSLVPTAIFIANFDKGIYESQFPYFKETNPQLRNST